MTFEELKQKMVPMKKWYIESKEANEDGNTRLHGFCRLLEDGTLQCDIPWCSFGEPLEQPIFIIDKEEDLQPWRIFKGNVVIE